jgi:hypothetical protein
LLTLRPTGWWGLLGNLTGASHSYSTYVQLNCRIKAAGVEMGDERAKVLHPLVADEACVGETCMDYLTFMELDLIVFLDEATATNDEALRRG